MIAGRLPGRTDNEVKNYWNTHLTKREITQHTKPEVPMLKRRKLLNHLADKHSTESICDDQSSDRKNNDESNIEIESTINGITGRRKQSKNEGSGFSSLDGSYQLQQQ